MPLSISDGALPWQRLAVVNKHPRDDRISFEEESHTYTIDGIKKGWISCTTFIHQFCQEFDADAIIAKMMGSPKWPQNKYYGQTANEIKALWDANRDAASGAGTRMHLDIEHYYNASPVGNLAGDEYNPNPSVEWDMFLAYEAKHGCRFNVYRSEWLVFDEETHIAGSIDMVYRKKDGTLAIYDWKRSKEIKTENSFQSMKGPLGHLPDTNYWHYSMQLNIYRRILQKNYNEKVTELALVVLHPDNNTYKILRLNFMDDEVDAMFECRRRAVESGANVPVIF